MRRIEFIAPVQSMRGNLSGGQTLEYATNNNPAYEAPDGKQTAKNYATRYIGAKKGKSTRTQRALNYFQARTKNTVVVNDKSKMQMALIAVCAGIRSAIGEQKRAQIQAIYEGLKAQYGESAPAWFKSVDTYWSHVCQEMLRYHNAQLVIAGPAGSVSIKNPYNMDDANAQTIASAMWIKFADMFTFCSTAVGGVFYTIDGYKFFAPNDSPNRPASFQACKAISNPNLVASLTDVTIVSDEVKFKGNTVYDGDTALTPGNSPEAGAKYSTIATA